MSADAFAAALRRFAAKTVPEAFGRAQDRLADRLLERIKELTPADTGETRAAWTKEEGSGPFREIVILNPLPHAALLEHGSSSQAPHGMVALAAAEAAAGTLAGAEDE